MKLKHVLSLELFKESLKMINETSYYDISDEELLSDKNIENIRLEYGDVLQGQYIDEDDFDENDFDENDDEYIEYIKTTYNDLLDEFRNNIEDCIVDNNIKIYRKITVDENWLEHLQKEGKHLGIYWSWSKDGAIAHGGDFAHKYEVLFEAEINEKYVDWKQTFLMNTHPSYTDEKEINLYKKSPIKLIRISIVNKHNSDDEDVITISNDKNLKDKKFYA